MTNHWIHFTLRSTVTTGSLVLLIYGSALAQESASVPYPTGFRGWTVVKSSLVGPQSKLHQVRGGFHHFYANSKAMEGYRSGTFPDGSVIVDEGVFAKDVDGVANEGERRSVEVMHKDSAAYKSTGGWGYDRFEADSTTSVATAQTRTACFSCHSARKDRDAVFSSPAHSVGIYEKGDH